jgi:myo-inositol-1-phosphate synthase
MKEVSESMGKIKVAIAGCGNCAASLLEGLEYYRRITAEKLKGKKKEVGCLGLMNDDMGGYFPNDIEVVAAFDIDKRKVGERLDVALRAKQSPGRNGTRPRRRFRAYAKLRR